MKKTTATAENTTHAPHLEDMTQKVTDYLYEHVRNIDKATLLKYAGIALLVFYGIRKSNILSGIAITLISGLITNLLAANSSDGKSSNEDVISTLLKKLA